MPAYLPEGFTENGYIAAADRAFEAVRFKFRPMSLAQRFACEESFRVKKGDDQARITFTVLEKQLVSWDVKAPGNAEPLPITKDNLARITPSLALRLYNIVAGYSASDLDPADASPGGGDESDALFESMFSGKSVGDAKAEADAKN